MDPREFPIKPGSKIRDDPVLLPVAEPRGIRSLLAADFGGSGPFDGRLCAARLGRGFGPLTRLFDALCDYVRG
jgi:hypothetical protein